MTHTLQNAGLLVARILLSAMFILAGIGKLGDVQGFAGYVASGGLPGFLAWPVIVLEILGGLALLVGFQTRLAALGLGLFSVATGVLYHFVPADQMQMTIFMKNLALAGGYLALALVGAGQWSADAALGRKSATATA
ncbi:MAG: DoxX family protein [Marinovum algicola]|jgi:putative oxidoreductase|uniref:Oxidoreductase n=1 Tax=Marinovum algicola TaxID=42444 RepID=A0A975W884_9RHOB|nr:DoxX family protein [Marinovum algicola]SEJ05298.1 putative oxidoreductase [Marinovum algicola]SLN18882.1 Inner membrane protein YqjF [Marinovum algicola]